MMHCRAARAVGRQSWGSVGCVLPRCPPAAGNLRDEAEPSSQFWKISKSVQLTMMSSCKAHGERSSCE